MAEKGLLPALLKGNCPRCRTGEMFTHGPWNIKHLGKMHQFCPACGHQFEEEPGFYYGAMYVSYALSTGLFLLVSALLYFVFDDPELEVYVAAVTGIAILLYPLTFRYSRILFTYIFSAVSYDPRWEQKYSG